ncbi:MAG: glycosyltransferase [Syntrophomonadaceae bacterium]|nr:glycosyltransferase [Syntrophomonadaceae bacterium]
MKTAVIIMSRIPEPGSTKTRLMNTINGHECAEFHRACLRDICRAVRNSGMEAFLYFTGDQNSVHEGKWPNSHTDLWGLTAADYAYFTMRRQKGADLGERMLNAAHDVLARYDSVILLGSDMPVLNPGLLEETRKRLHENDLVIGPAEDGGYYLLGCKRVHAELFKDIPWGTGNVLHLTIQEAEKRGLICTLLPAHSDIDTWNDLVSFYEKGLINKEYCDLDSYIYAAMLIGKAKQMEGSY